MGGILVAVTIKYADNILRGFAQGLALIVGALGSYFLFEFKITPLFIGGVILVIVATFLYGIDIVIYTYIYMYTYIVMCICMYR